MRPGMGGAGGRTTIGARWRRLLGSPGGLASVEGTVRLLALVIALAAPLFWGGGGEARASTQGYSQYERETIEDACRQLGLRLESAAEGRAVGAIHLVRLEVFERRDPMPRFLNVFHFRTLPGVIRSALLFREGEPFDSGRVAESARALRDRSQLSLVLIVPVRGQVRGTVDILVIVKDVWSLRLNWNAQMVNNTLSELVLQPSETNLAGTHTLLGGLFTLRPDTYTFGGFASQRNLDSSRLAISLDAGAITNRESGAVEGSFGSFYYGLPLYSLASRWGWLVTVNWRVEVDRLYNGARQAWFDGRDVDDGTSCTAATIGCVPYEYRADLWSGVYELTRSYGVTFKTDVSVGAEVLKREYHALGSSVRDESTRERFERRALPVSDMRVSPFLQLRNFEGEFAQVLDYMTLGLQEDVQVGHDVVLRLYPASRSVASSRDLIGSRAAASYTVVPAHGVIRVAVTNEMQISAPGQSDARFTGRLHLATPPLGFGRFVADGMLSVKYADYLNRRVYLGGNGRLRGYLPDEFVGRDVISQNIEFRSRPFEVWSAQVGAALFYDAGDAVDGLRHLVMKHATGVGLRVLFPQLDRAVFRADWGIPLVDPMPSQHARGAPTSRTGFSQLPGQLYVSFEQAFGTPTVAPELSTRQ